jgi:hypothetical protein
MRDGVDDLVARAAQHRGGYGGGSDAHQQHVVEADAVEGIFQGQDALDFVGLDHESQEVPDFQLRVES